MQKLKKIMETIVIFIFIMLLICFTISFYHVITGEFSYKQILSKTGLYFLYTIGYGALEGDAFIQNILAIIGIVALALMSTFLTINLFWRLDDVTISKSILYNPKHLQFLFQNKGRTICDMKVSFMLYNTYSLECTEESREYYMPMLIKRAKWNLKVNLNDTFWYRTVYYLLSTNFYKLYCIFSFVDTKNGQSSIKVEEFTSKNITDSKNTLSYESFTAPITLSCKNLLPIEFGGSISLTEEKKEMVASYTFPKNAKKNENFVMAFYDFHANPLNLEKYNRNTTTLEIPLFSEKEVSLTLEIKMDKNVKYTQMVLITKETKKIVIPLSSIPENLEKVIEICFTIFPNHNAYQNQFSIGDLTLYTK